MKIIHSQNQKLDNFKTLFRNSGGTITDSLRRVRLSLGRMQMLAESLCCPPETIWHRGTGTTPDAALIIRLTPLSPRDGPASSLWRDHNAAGEKTRKGKAHENRTKEGPRTRVKTSGKINSPPGQPNLHRAGQAQWGGDKCIKGGSLERLGHLFSQSFGSARPHSSRVYYPLFFLIKLSYNTGPSVASNFCCSKTEARKLHTPRTSLVPFLGFNLAETTLAPAP